MKLKELNELPFGIVGKIEIMLPKRTLGESEYYEYENIKEAIKDFGELEMFQIFGRPSYDLDTAITIVLIDNITPDHPERR